MREQIGKSLVLAIAVGLALAPTRAHAQTFDYATCDPTVTRATACSGAVGKCCEIGASAGSTLLLSGTDKAIVIPMDFCHQAITDSPTSGTAPVWCSDRPATDGMLPTYGLIYRLLQNGIPVYWIVNPSKDPVSLGSSNNVEIPTDIDMWVLDSTVANPPGSLTNLTAAGVNPVVKHMTGGFTAPNFGYDGAYTYSKKEFPIRGSAFLIAAKDRANFNKFVNRQAPYNNWATRSGCGNGGFCYDFRSVNMYEIQSTAHLGWTDFTVVGSGGGVGATGFRVDKLDVAATLAYKPPTVAKIPDSGVSQKWLGQANLQDISAATCSSTGLMNPVDSVYCAVSETDIQNDELINGGFGWLWIDDQTLSCGNTMTHVRKFLTAVASTYTPGNVMAIADGVGNESCGSQQLLGKEQATPGLAVSNGSGPSPLILRYPQSLYMQWGDTAPDFANGQTGAGWGFFGGSVGYNTAFGTGANSLHRLVSGDVAPTCLGQKSSAICDLPGPYVPTAKASVGFVGAAGNDGNDVTSYGRFENGASNGIVYYLPGTQIHQHTAELRMLLDSVIATPLGTVVQTPPVVKEVSRASPVVATIQNRRVLVQGTYEYVTPAPTKYTVSAPADLATFEFPYQKGHMRAIDDSTIGAGGATFGSLAPLFDSAAAVTMPTVSYTGCGTPYDGTCRSIFTTTTTGSFNPTMVPVDEAHAATLGPLMGIAGPTFSATDQKTFIDRILAGHFSAGVYTPALGGVDRSTVAVIEASAVAGGARPKMAYFGGTDGMIHAVCASLLGNCTRLGRELWAYIPRTNLPLLRLNSGRVDGSPRVIDALGDFTTGLGTGTKTFRTILTFQTGTGDPTTAGQTPAIYALDITDPFNPKVLWEYTTPTVRGVNELGVGLTVAANPVNFSGTTKYIAYAETNNGGTGGAGVVVTPIDMQLGTKLSWTFGYTYPSPPRLGGDTSVAASGIPGGAVGVDKTGAGLTTHVVFDDLYGNLWEIDPVTGDSIYHNGGGVIIPLFSFSTDYHPIGAKPAIYSDGSTQYAVVVSGGYADPSDTTWGPNSVQQYLAAVALFTYPTSSTASLDENSGTTYIKNKVALGCTGGVCERGYAQALVVGNQVFFTTDSADVNGSTYGTGGATGHLYSYNLGNNAPGTTYVLAGGASSAVNDGTTLFTGSSDTTQQIPTGATSTIGPSVDSLQAAKVSRMLWLRTE